MTRPLSQRISLPLVVVIVLAALTAGTLGAQSAKVATERAGLPVRHVSSLATPQADQGRVDSDLYLDRLAIVLAPSADQQADLTALIGAQQDPASPDYRKWLTPAEYAERFAPSSESLARLQQWLEDQGFAIRSVAPSGNWIAFSGDAGQVMRAFRAEIHAYVIGGEDHFATATEPTLPAEFAGLVTAIRGLDDFLPSATSARTGGEGSPAPDLLAEQYGIAALYRQGFDGVGQRIAIAGQSTVNLADVSEFRAKFGLPARDPQVVLPPGDTEPGDSGAALAAYDLKWAGAIARSADLTYVYSADAFDAVQYAVTHNIAPVLVTRYGICEDGADATAAALRVLARQAAAEGISWIAGSGDSGAEACAASGESLGVRLPASLPEVTAVGGVDTVSSAAAARATVDGSALTAWRPAGDLAPGSGGGPSAIFAKPGWQSAPGVPDDGARDIPDISMAASSGGTALAADMFAGIAALLNQYAGAVSGLGNLNPSLYALAQAGNPAIQDVTAGDSLMSPAESSGTVGYSAGAGYDLVTGLGSVNAGALASAVRAGKPLDATSTPPALSAVTVYPATVIGGQVASVVISLTAAAPAGGAAVTLSSSNATAFPLPAGATIAAGDKSVTLKVTTAAVTANASVTVTATYAGANKTGPVTVTPVPPAALVSVTASPSTVIGGAAAGLIVHLSSPAPTGGAVVTLAGGSTVFPVPASMTIPAGGRSAAVKVQTTAVTASTSLTITATYSGVSKTAAVTVTPAPPAVLAGLTISPASLIGGASAYLTVALSGVAPSGGATVALSGGTTAFPVPTTAAIAAGERSAAMKIQTGAVTASTPVTITATYAGVSKTATATLAPAALAKLSVSPATVVGGSAAAVIVSLNGRAPAGGVAVTLASSAATAFPLPASANIAAGESSALLKVQTAAVSASTAVTVTATCGGVSKTASITVTPAALVSVSVSPAAITGGKQASLLVSLNGTAPAGGAAVSISSSAATAFPVPAGITVPAGERYAKVVVQTAVVTATTPVTITATFGGVSKTAAVTVAPVPPPVLTGVMVNPASLTGGSTASVAVSLNGPAQTGGAVVALSTSGAALPVPASITIAAGQMAAYVKVQSSAVSAATTVTVTAAFSGVTKTATVTLNPAALSSVAINPASVIGGNSASLVASLSGPAPAGGASIKLSSSNAAFPVPASVTIAAGERSAGLKVVTTSVTASAAVTVTATYGGGSKTATVSLTPVPPPVLAAVMVAPATVPSGGSATVVVALSAAAPSAGATVALTSGNAAFPVPASVTIAAAKTATATVKAGTVTASTSVTVTAAYGGVSKTATVTVTPAATTSGSSATATSTAGSK